MLTFHSSIPSEEKADDLFPTWGEIYIETEKGYFPCVGWKDVLSVVAVQWIGNMIRMLDPTYGEQHVVNYFMDGPYYFDLQRIEQDCLNIRFYKNVRGSEKVDTLPSLTTTITEYSNALIRLAEDVMNSSNIQALKERDRNNLMRAVALLKPWL